MANNPLSIPARLVQTLVAGTVIKRRTDANGQKHLLLRWVGAAGEQHEVWYPARDIKLDREEA